MSGRISDINVDLLLYHIQSSFLTHMKYIDGTKNISDNVEVTNIAIVGSFLNNESTGDFNPRVSDLDIIVLTNNSIQKNIADSFRRYVNDELKLDGTDLVDCEVSKIDCVDVLEESRFNNDDNRPSEKLIR